MSSLAAMIREAERMRSAVRIVGPEPEDSAPPKASGGDSPRETPVVAAPVVSPWERYVEESECARAQSREDVTISTVRLTEDQMEQLRTAMAPPPEVMTLHEAAFYLRVGRSTVLDMVHDDGLPAAKLAGKWRFKRSALDQWLEIHLSHFPRPVR
ncbi:MAG: helix-turn-helix domain-containing protein [Armatimonadetes bacterium]|nr:helix-turn-helix domain-containing protein [Armatimonadota bacterium]